MRKAESGTRSAWTRLPDSALLDRPLRSLGLRIEGSKLERRVERLHDELGRAGLRFRPYVWLSTDWFTPVGVTGFAIPFYLAHPRLEKLERRIMHEVEGDSLDSCMRLLRHEAAHAIDHAYRLHWRKRWREVFGRASEPYRMSYAPHVTSRDHVHNLDYFYSQSHPLEDFCETFSVWLDPRSHWRERYEGWPALKKLEYVDELMREIAQAPPKVRSRTRPDNLARLRFTLREHYRRKQRLYRHDLATEYDEYLMRVFTTDRRSRDSETAADFMLRARQQLRRHVAAVTGQHQYVIDQVFNELILRCRRLDLRVARSEPETVIEATALLTSFTVGVVRGQRAEYWR